MIRHNRRLVQQQHNITSQSTECSVFSVVFACRKAVQEQQQQQQQQQQLRQDDAKVSPPPENINLNQQVPDKSAAERERQRLREQERRRREAVSEYAFLCVRVEFEVYFPDRGLIC